MTSSYPLREKVWLGLALLHLSLMALGASQLFYAWTGPTAEAALDYYGELSGASEGYGFFAPGVDGQLRAVFEVTDQSGKVREVPLVSGENNEADLRVGNIIDTFQNDEEDPVKFQRALSSSLAGSLFGRFPGARDVTVRLEDYKPVSMVEFRDGKRGQWSPVYRAKYALASASKAKSAKGGSQ